MRKTWAYAFLALGAVVISCGGAADTGLFNDATGTADTPDGAASDGAARSDGGGKRDGGGSDGGTRADGGGSDSGPFPNDSSIGTDTSPPPQNRIDCATTATSCALGSQVCCRTGDVNTPAFNCSAAAGCSAVGSLPIPCDDPDDCTKLGQPGEVCCAHLDGQNHADLVSCLPHASCPTANNVEMCDPLAPVPCPNGGSCNVSVTILPGFNLCL